MMQKRLFRLLYPIGLALATVLATPALSAPGGTPGKPPGTPGGGEEEETGTNNLSFPVVFPSSGITIPNDQPQGSYSLDGEYYFWDGRTPPCQPATDAGCNTGAAYRVYIQKDPANDWQAIGLRDRALRRFRT